MDEQPRIPSRLLDAEALERERHAHERRDAVGQQRQRPRQLPGPRLHCLAVLGADDVERAEHAVDDGVRDRGATIAAATKARITAAMVV